MLPPSLSTPLAAPAPAPETAALVAGLDAGERGFVLGALVMLGAELPPDTAALAGESGRRCAVALENLAALERTERLRLMELLARDVLAPVPAGCSTVHPDALRGLLEDESDEVVRLLATGDDDLPETLRTLVAERIAASSGPADPAPEGAEKRGEQDGGAADPAEAAKAHEPTEAGGVVAAARTEILRAVLAPIVPVPETVAAAGHRPGLALATLAPAALLRELGAAGADLLGTSLQGAEAPRVERALLGLGEPWAGRVRVAAARDSRLATPGALTRVRARALIAGTSPADTPLGTLHRLGAAAVGASLSLQDPAAVQPVAQRLPADLARLVRDTADEGPP